MFGRRAAVDGWFLVAWDVCVCVELHALGRLAGSLKIRQENGRLLLKQLFRKAMKSRHSYTFISTSNFLVFCCILLHYFLELAQQRRTGATGEPTGDRHWRTPLANATGVSPPRGTETAVSTRAPQKSEDVLQNRIPQG